MANVVVDHVPTSGLVVVSAPYPYKEAILTIPTRRWDPRRAAWTFPRSPWVCATILSVLAAETAKRGDTMTIADVVRITANDARHVEDLVSFLADQPITRSIGSRFDPWRHQFIGSRLIRNLRSVYLAWEMGTGKTKGVIDAMLDLHAGGPRRFLIIAPASVVSVWQGEIPKHVEAPDRTFVVAASRHRVVAKRVKAAQDAMVAAKESARSLVVVTNYESFVGDGSPFLAFVKRHTWDAIILDEAHRIASPGSKTTRLLTDQVRPLCARAVLLSGTPLRNSPLDVYSQCKFLDPGIFGTQKQSFLERYAVLDFFGGVVGLQREDELSSRFAVLAHRVDKRSVLDLPPVTNTVRRFRLSDEAQGIYDRLEKQLVVDVDNGQLVAANAMVQLLRAQQLTSGFMPVVNEAGVEAIREIDAAKAVELAELLDEIRPDEPVAVFARFTRDLATIKRVAQEKGRGFMELSGNANELAAWQAAKGGEVIGVQIKSGGIGVDLTRAAYSVFYSIGFSLADYEQALARVDRPGQTRPVTITNLVARGTVDEAVFGAIESKKDVVEGVLDYLRGRRNGG